MLLALPNRRFSLSCTSKVQKSTQDFNQQGKALILFTAKRDMEDIFVKLCETNHSYDILMQKPGISQNDLIREFKNNIDSVLLGTGTFWEGINVEGICFQFGCLFCFHLFSISNFQFFFCSL